MKELGIKLLTESAKLPTRSYDDSLGYDLYADSIEEIPDNFGEIIKIHTGIIVQFPDDYGGIICDRSGMALKGYFTVGGIIDNSFTGELLVIMHKDKALDNPEKGDKIAQLLLFPTPYFPVIEYEEIKETVRGNKGFNSSGK